MRVGVVLARLQPIHNGHLALIEKAASENDNAYVFVGSANKFNARNPIDWQLRVQLAEEATKHLENVNIVPLDDLSSEDNNDYLWGFYLYSKIVSYTHEPNFTIYYSDGFEIITTWFPGFILRNNVSLSLLARNSIEEGISATKVREYILNGDDENLKKVVPECVYNLRENIKTRIELTKLL